MAIPVRRRVTGARLQRRAGARPRGRLRRLVSAGRVLGAASVVGAALAGGWLTSDEQFALDEARIEITGLVHTDVALARERLGLAPGGTPNIFRLATGAMERSLLELPAVESVEVRAVLPDGVVVRVTERVPLFAWRAGGHAFLVDGEGRLIAELAPAGGDAGGGDAGGGDAGGGDAGGGDAGGLPVVDDRRPPTGEPPAVGGTLDPIDLDAILRLAAITPELLGSRADRLELSIERADGFVLRAEPDGWRAVFGHYTPTLRTTALIDRQVQCLRSQLATGEAAIDTVYLAAGDDTCGTFLPRATERPDPTPGASSSPAASPDD